MFSVLLLEGGDCQVQVPATQLVSGTYQGLGLTVQLAHTPINPKHKKNCSTPSRWVCLFYEFPVEGMISCDGTKSMYFLWIIWELLWEPRLIGTFYSLAPVCVWALGSLTLGPWGGITSCQLPFVVYLISSRKHAMSLSPLAVVYLTLHMSTLERGILVRVWVEFCTVFQTFNVSWVCVLIWATFLIVKK